ncbi:phosphatase PAP2 family protein [Lottiidibacillus patelloidae]|nr:phosphatase PAP2 family protein [Lottiidibacillus patelloidae]
MMKVETNNKLQLNKKSNISMVIVFISILIFTYLAISIKEGSSFIIDAFASSIVDMIETEMLTAIMIGFTSLGSKAGIISMFLLGLLWAGIRYRHYAPLLGLVITVAGGDFLNKKFKSLVGRDRPLINNEVEGVGHSFPSGHAMVALAFYGFLAYLIIMQLKKSSHKTIVVISVSIMILFIGLSRVYLHVHYLTDVIGGFAAGIAVLGLTVLLVNLLAPKLKR